MLRPSSLPAQARLACVLVGLVGGVIALPATSQAADPDAWLRVTREPGAEGCPNQAKLATDFNALAARDASRLGQGSLTGIDIEVAFWRPAAGGYAATLTAKESAVDGTRTLADRTGSCDTLAQAVVATLVVLLDPLQAAVPPSPTVPGNVPAPPGPPSPPRSAGTADGGARAVDPDDAPPTDPAARSADARRAARSSRGPPRWYGWQMALVDAGTLGIAVAAFGLDAKMGTIVLGGALGSYVVSGPVFHAVHGRPGAAVGSVLLRLFVPVAGGIVGGLVGPSCTTPPGSMANPWDSVGCVFAVAGRVMIGFGVGALVASAIDDGALGWDRGPADPSVVAAPRIAPFAVIASDRDRGSIRVVGIAGTF